MFKKLPLAIFSLVFIIPALLIGLTFYDTITDSNTMGLFKSPLGGIIGSALIVLALPVAGILNHFINGEKRKAVKKKLTGYEDKEQLEYLEETLKNNKEISVAAHSNITRKIAELKSKSAS